MNISTMEHFLIAVTSITFAIFTTVSCCDIVSLSFPSTLRIGAASASYQIEGAWNTSDKGESYWDRRVHTHPEDIIDGSDGDIACNSYNKYKEDVQWIKSIGLDHYRFSISWTRVLPTGFTNVISQDGLQYYKNLTAELVANGIEPIVTMYHWDHPQIFQEMGGWTNELIVDWFVAYARVLFEALGGTVKKWVTINEPEFLCPIYEPNYSGEVVFGIGMYLCGHNILKAHAKTYRMYDEEFRENQQGLIGIVSATFGNIAAESGDNVTEDNAFQFNLGWMKHPIYHGDYPEIMKTRIATISKVQGYPRSRLPEFSDEWLAIIKGTADYFGFNHYASKLKSPDPDEDEELGIYNSDSGLITSYDSNWPIASGKWFHVNPSGFSFVLRKIKDEYDNPPVWIMENGFPDTGNLDDYDRISYFYEYLREMLIAVKRDGCNVERYTIWSILDNFEWEAGYTKRYGIISVDFDNPDRPRSAKLSTSWWKRVLAARRLQTVPKNPNSQTRLPWTR